MSTATATSLSPRDEANLTWFFSAGQTMFERSPMGGMLERAEQFAVPSLSVSVAVRSEAGHVIGYTSGIDARPTAEARNVVVHAPDDGALALYGLISRRLMLLERQLPIAVICLEALYGDLGARWAVTRHGRIAAVFHLTDAGRRLIEADDRERVAKKQPPAVLAPHLRMANEIEGARGVGGTGASTVSRERADRRRVGLMRCERQAMELRAMACAAWSQVKAEQRGRAA